MSIRSLADLALNAFIQGKKFTPSPSAWEDEVFYFLLVDRFSDGNEKGYRDRDGNIVNTGTTPLFQPGDALNAVQTPADAAHWRDAGGGYVGGTIAGITSKLGYLKRMGVPTDSPGPPLAWRSRLVVQPVCARRMERTAGCLAEEALSASRARWSATGSSSPRCQIWEHCPPSRPFLSACR